MTVVEKILENPKEFDGRRVFVSSECLTLTQMAQAMSEGRSRVRVRVCVCMGGWVGGRVVGW